MAFGKSLKVGLLHFPPFGIQNPNNPNEISGIMVDELSRTFDYAQIDFSIHAYPPKRLFKLFENGSIDFILASKNQISRFKKVAIFSDDTIVKMTLRSYTANQKIELPEKKEDFKGKKIIAINGYLYAGYLHYFKDPNNHITIYYVNSHKPGLLMLLAGRADFLLDYAAPVESIITEMGKHRFRYSNLLEMSTHFALSKKYPNHENILEKIIQSYYDQKKLVYDQKND